MKKKTYPYLYDVIAGHIDAGENPDDAVQREVKEETGLEVTNTTLLAHTTINPDSCRRGIDIHAWYLYLCNVSGQMQENPEATFMKWMDKKEMQSLEFVPAIKIIFEQLDFFKK